MRFLAVAGPAAAPGHAAPVEAVPEADPGAAAADDDLLHIGCCDALLAAATDGPLYALCGVDCRHQRIHLTPPPDTEVCPLCVERAEAATTQAEAAGVSACELVCPNRTFGGWDAG